VGDPPFGQFRHQSWLHPIPFFGYPPEIRKVIYTTNAIGALNMSLREIIKIHVLLPNGDVLVKLFYLAVRNIGKKWTMSIRDWKAVLTWFAIQIEDRMPRRYTKSLNENPFTQNVAHPLSGTYLRVASGTPTS
jgi:putative transposase